MDSPSTVVPPDIKISFLLPSPKSIVVEEELPTSDEEDKDEIQLVYEGCPPPLQDTCALTPDNFRELFSSIQNQNQRMTWLSQEFQTLTLPSQLREFVSAVAQSPVGTSRRRQLIVELHSLLKTEFPSCLLYPFGSQLTGLGEEDSDLDIFVDVHNTNEKRPKALPIPEVKRVLNVITKLLRRHRYFCGDLQPIRNAKVPIVRFIHTQSRVQVDLSFGSLLAVRNSEFISLCMNIHPVIPLLMRLVRFWARYHDLSGSFKIKNYCLCLLVLVYCGQEQIVPSLLQMQGMEGVGSVQQLETIDGWDTRFPTQTKENVDQILSTFPPNLWTGVNPSTLAKKVVNLLRGFFSFYANLDFESHVVCTNTHEIVPRDQWESWGRQNSSMYRWEGVSKYANWLRRRKAEDRLLNVDAPLCVQDPFALNVNVGGVTKKDLLLQFQHACRETEKVMRDGVQSLLHLFSPVTRLLPPDCSDTDILQKNRLGSSRSQQLVAEVRSMMQMESDDKGEKYVGLWMKAGSKFVRQFARCVNQLDLIKIAGSWSLLQKLKSLWVISVIDFLTKFFEQCFKMEVSTTEHISELGASSTEPGAGERNGKKYPEIQFFREAKLLGEGRGGNTNIEDIPDGKRNIVRMKVEKLAEQEANVCYKMLHCKSSLPILFSRRGREAAWVNLQTQNQQASSQKGEEPPTKRPKLISDNKAATTSQNPVDVTKWTGPLEVESRVSDSILETSSTEGAQESDIDADEVVEFNVYVKLDSSVGDELPTLTLVVAKQESEAGAGTETEKSKSATDIPSMVASTLSKNLSVYDLHYLKTWLELPDLEIHTPQAPHTFPGPDGGGSAEVLIQID